METEQKCHRLLDHVATYPSAFIRYYAIEMILHVDSDEAYNVMPKARSRIVGYYYLAENPNTTQQNQFNSPLLIECKIMRHVVASAAGVEIGDLFRNTQTSIPIRIMLKSLGHLKLPTPILTDNSSAYGFIYDNINSKKSKIWDMRYYCFKG